MLIVLSFCVYRRSASWQPFYYYLGQALLLESIGVTVRVEDIYERVENSAMLQWLATLEAPQTV